MPTPRATRPDVGRTMTGILAIWNDCAPEGEAHYERWYKSEHMQERVGVPGFRFGRRYERLAGGDRRFFTFYEVERADVLSSRAYVERLENPTPWTTESMKYFRNMVRTVCEQRAAAGDLIGSHAVVVRADEAMAPTAEAESLVARLAAEPGVARVQLWTAATKQTPADTVEMKKRGKDQLAAGAFLVECIRRADADRIAATLAPAALGVTGKAVVGVYGLLCIYERAG
jgi:hypothetical protein